MSKRFLRKPGVEELDEIIRLHRVWIESRGKSGAKAKLNDCNLEKLDLSKRNLSRANLGRSNCSETNFTGANLEKADFTQSDLTNVNFTKACLRGAILSESKLHGASFKEAIITDSNLSGSDTTKAIGLIGTQFGGTNLAGAALPESVHVESSLNDIADLAKNAKIVLIALILGCFYCWLTIGSTNDVDLLSNSISSKLPLIDVELPISVFYFVGPIILFAGFLYLQLYLQRLWEALATLPAVFPDGRILADKVYPWLFIGFIGSQLRWHNLQRPAFSRLQFVLCILLAYCLIPITLYIFWGGYLTKQDWPRTHIHVWVIAFSVYCGLRFYFAARTTIRRRKTTWTDRLFPIAVSCFIGFALSKLSLGSIYGERHNFPADLVAAFNSSNGRYSKPVIAKSDTRYWVPALLEKSLVNSFADFSDADVSIKPSNWHGDTNEYPQVKGANLRLVSLRHLNGFRAFLVNAQLQFANLESAYLSFANLHGANLSYAYMPWSVFQSAQLQGANLEWARLTGGTLFGSNLERANIQWANLDGVSGPLTSFADADLSHSTFESAVLVCANFSNAISKDVNFSNAHLAGSQFVNANCVRAKFRMAHLGGADFSGANLAYADLSGIVNWTQIGSLKSANLFSVTNSPDGFLEWATNKMGAIIVPTEDEWTVRPDPTPSVQK